MTTNLPEIKFPKDSSYTTKVFFVNSLLFSETMRSYKNGAPTRYYIYEVQPANDTGTAELAVSETVHREIQITRPGPSDMCILYKKRTQKGYNMNAIQFPDANHFPLPTTQSTPADISRSEQPTSQPRYFSEKEKEYGSMTSAIIGVSWAMEMISSSLLSDFAALTAAELRPGQHEESRRRINERINLVLRIRDQEARKYYESLHSTASERQEPTPLPAEPEFNVSPSGINLNDIPF